VKRYSYRKLSYVHITSDAEEHQGSLSPTIPRLRAAYNQRSGPGKWSCLLIEPGLLAAKIADRMGSAWRRRWGIFITKRVNGELRCPTSCSRPIRKLEKRLKRSSVNEGNIAESKGRRAIRDRYPDVHPSDAWIYIQLRQARSVPRRYFRMALRAREVPPPIHPIDTPSRVWRALVAQRYPGHESGGMCRSAGTRS
jgi:hypothetical protein